jgi:hypothetical protein
MDSKQATVIVANESGTSGGVPPRPSRVGGRSVSAKKKRIVAKPKGALASKAKKAARPARLSARPTSKAERLVCRYCGSDDLAPSFKKRRDCRCRACFKKRYGSVASGKRPTQSPEAKAAK